MTSDGIKTGKTLSVLTGNTIKADADKLDGKTINDCRGRVVTNLNTDTSGLKLIQHLPEQEIRLITRVLQPHSELS